MRIEAKLGALGLVVPGALKATPGLQPLFACVRVQRTTVAMSQATPRRIPKAASQARIVKEQMRERLEGSTPIIA